MFKSTKRFSNFSCAHRQPAHDGHCQFLHGYSRSFYFVFGADEVDPATHFVMDFSGLKKVKAWLDDTFDHTCLINADDPELELFKQLDERGIIQLRTRRGKENNAKWTTMLDEEYAIYHPLGVLVDFATIRGTKLGLTFEPMAVGATVPVVEAIAVPEPQTIDRGTAALLH